MQSQDTTPLHLSTNPVSQRQLPIVTCFVPNLPHGCPFRVSLHCWPEQPEVSRGTQALTSSKDSVFFETRVLLDGVHVGYGPQAVPLLVDRKRRTAADRLITEASS